MYAPSSMRVTDPAVIRRLIDDFPFATLVSHGPTPHLTHAPLYCPDGDRDLREIRGHIARANPHAAALAGAPATAVFRGPHAYVSPRWYGDTDQVPTWNYLAVHVHGSVEVTTDPTAAEAQLREQIRRLEGDRWAPSDQLLRGKLPGVTLFRLRVDRIEATAKLSQNKNDHDRRAVRETLAASDRDSDRELARWMA